MTVTAYDIIAQLKMAPDQYLEARVFNPRFVSQPKLVTLRVEPLRYVNKSENFRVPSPGANQLANELNTIFVAARALTT